MVSLINKLDVPLLGIVYIVSVIIVFLYYYEKIDLGFLTLISWFIVLLGALGFVCYVFKKVSKTR